MGDKLAFNAAGSCCLLVDGEFLMHVTLLPAKRLFVYAPLLDGLPAHQLARLALCERVLLGALESDEDVPGSVGILHEHQLIIYHREVDLRDAAHDALRLMCAAFVGAVKRWRQRLQGVLHTVEGVCLAAASPATKRRACRDSAPTPARAAQDRTDLSHIARLAVASAAVDQFIADALVVPLVYERAASGILVRLQGLTLRYVPACDRIVSMRSCWRPPPSALTPRRAAPRSSIATAASRAWCCTPPCRATVRCRGSSPTSTVPSPRGARACGSLPAPPRSAPAPVRARYAWCRAARRWRVRAPLVSERCSAPTPLFTFTSCKKHQLVTRTPFPRYALACTATLRIS